MRLSLICNRYFWGHLTIFLTVSLLYLLLYNSLHSEVKAKEVIAQTTILSKYFYDTGLAIGAYGLTRNQMFAERYNKLAAQIPDALEGLHQLTNNEPAATRRFDAVRQTVEKGLAELSASKQMLDNGQLGSFADDQGQTRRAYKQIKLIADALQQELDELSAEEQKAAMKASRLRFVFVTLSALVLSAYIAYNCIVQIKANKPG